MSAFPRLQLLQLLLALWRLWPALQRLDLLLQAVLVAQERLQLRLGPLEVLHVGHSRGLQS